jgi:hypothetical protein
MTLSWQFCGFFGVFLGYDAIICGLRSIMVRSGWYLSPAVALGHSRPHRGKEGGDALYL